MLPPVYVRFSYSYKSDELVCGAKEIAIEKVELEKRFDDVIPAVVVYAGGKQLFIICYAFLYTTKAGGADKKLD